MHTFILEKLSLAQSGKQVLGKCSIDMPGTIGPKGLTFFQRNSPAYISTIVAHIDSGAIDRHRISQNPVLISCYRSMLKSYLEPLKSITSMLPQLDDDADGDRAGESPNYLKSFSRGDFRSTSSVLAWNDDLFQDPKITTELIQ